MADDISQAFHDEMPLTALLGVEGITASSSEVRARLPWSDTTCTAGGVMHGGALMSLADATGAYCAFLNLPDGAHTTTVESKTNFLRGVRDGYVEAISRPLHAGRTVIVVETELRDAEDRLVAKTTQTQAVLSAS